MKALIDCKSCRVCGESKPLSEFHPNKQCKLGVVGTCRSCTRERINKWYDDNRCKRREEARNRARKRKSEVVTKFGDMCSDCKLSFPQCVYEFHHLDPSMKDINPSVALSAPKWESEFDKCVMLCANCHRIRHHLMREELSLAKEVQG